MSDFAGAEAGCLLMFLVVIVMGAIIQFFVWLTGLSESEVVDIGGWVLVSGSFVYTAIAIIGIGKD